MSKQDIINCNLSLEQDPINGRRYNITIAIMEEEEEEDDEEDDLQNEADAAAQDACAVNLDLQGSVEAAIALAMQKRKP